MDYTILPFPKGKIFLVKGPKGLQAASFFKNDAEAERMVEQYAREGLLLEASPDRFEEEKRRFERYFSGSREDFASLKLDLSGGTPFYQRVWREARKVPYGGTTTYKSLAKSLGHRGYRSIGQALAKNPLLIIVPCHRVLGSDGSLTGFGAGLPLKKYLLDLEKP